MPSRLLLQVLVSCVILFSSWTMVAGQDDPDGWKKPITPVRIVGPIHYVGTYGLAVYLIATPAGHILIDGTVPVAAPDIVDAIQAAGFAPRDVKILLNTQAHFDHVGSLAHLKQVTGGRVLVMQGDERLIASGGKADYLFGARDEFHFPAVEGDEVISDGHVVSLGGVSLTAHLTPGHTPGTTTWTMTVEEGGQSYRVVFAGSTFVNPGTRLVDKPSYVGIEADYRRSFAMLEALPVDIPLGAHAQAFDFHAKRERAKSEGARAYVDPGALHKAARTSRAAFEKLIATENAKR